MPKRVVFLVCLIMLISGCSKTSGLNTLQERQRLSIMHSELSFQFLLNQNIDVAQGEAEEAIRLYRDGVEANHAMARVHQALNNHQQVLEYYRLALKTDPDSVFVLNDYGQYLCDQGQPDQALKNYNRAGRQLMNPLRMVSYTRAAACSVRHNKYNDAQHYLLKALELNPDSLPVLFNLARVSYFKRDFKSASKYLGRYFKGTQTPSAEALALAQKLETDI